MNLKMPRIILCLGLFFLVMINVAIQSKAVGPESADGSEDTAVSQTAETAPSSQSSTVTTTSATETTTTTTTTEYREEVVLEFPYYVQVDKKAQVVTVFTTNEEGKYEKIVRQMICSTGRDHNKFPDGMYRLKDRKFEWRAMISHGEPSYAQYACTISGDFLFHSVTYETRGKKNSLFEWRFEELGTAASGGCIRLTVEGAKWIYDNCPPGTPVCIMTGDTYDEELIERLRPPAPENGWDPTDPDPNNPNYRPIITTPDPQPDKYAPLYDYDWDWAKEVTKVAQRTTTTTAAPTTAAATEAPTTAAPTAAEQTTAAPTAAPTDPAQPQG